MKAYENLRNWLKISQYIKALQVFNVASQELFERPN